MGFLDNLESNLKALESREEKDPAQRREEQAAREAEKAEALRAAPYAEALRSGPFSCALITACRTLGHAKRVMVRPTWLGARRRMDLQPTGDGVWAVYSANGEETGANPWTCMVMRPRWRKAGWSL